jgi:putative intracellular protease/amidase
MLKKVHLLLLLAILGLLCQFAYAADKVLIVVSSHGTADHQQPGYEFDEFSLAYEIFRNNGLDIDVASPTGGAVVADKFDSSKPYNARVLADRQAMAKLAKTLATSKLAAEDYRAVYVVGGKGAMFDLPTDKALKKLIAQIYQDEGVISAVCHGPAALVDVRLEDGRYLVAGHRVSAFTNEEEKYFSKGVEKKYPFMLEDRLGERGAVFEGALLMLPHLSVSERLITGQNPFSTALVAEAVVQALGKQPLARVHDAEERSMTLLARVAKGELAWAKRELAQRPAAYQMPLIAAWGNYAAMAAVQRADIERAAAVMELARPHVPHPQLRLALAKAYVRLGESNRAHALLTQLVKERPDMQEALELLAKLKG